MKSIIYDMILFLDDNQNQLFTETIFISNFMKFTGTYTYKNKVVKPHEIKKIIQRIWDEFCTENMEGFNLLKIFYDFNISIDNIMNKHKTNLFSKFILIDKHVQRFEEINETLIKNNSHYEDNQIILDLYEYHLKRDIIFIFITFDKDFYKALVKSNFDFIKKVYNIEDIRRFTENI